VQNGNEAIADTDSEAFARWMHHHHAPSSCLYRGISFHCHRGDALLHCEDMVIDVQLPLALMMFW